jgi:hypothetical protein
VTEHDITALAVLFRQFCDAETQRTRELAIARSYFEQTIYHLRMHHEKQAALEGAQEA